jgi:hypothetical protein
MPLVDTPYCLEDKLFSLLPGLGAGQLLCV